MSKVNKMGIVSVSLATLVARGSLNVSVAQTSYIASWLGLTGAFATISTLGPILWVAPIVAMAAWVFAWAGYLNLVGQVLEFKNMVLDVFDTPTGPKSIEDKKKKMSVTVYETFKKDGTIIKEKYPFSGPISKPSCEADFAWNRLVYNVRYK